MVVRRKPRVLVMASSVPGAGVASPEWGTTTRKEVQSPADPTMLPANNPHAAPGSPHAAIHHQTSTTVSTAAAAPTQKIARGRSMLARALEAGVPIDDAKVASARRVTTAPCPSYSCP